MARGFKDTQGVGTTDKVVSALNAHALQRTYVMWALRRTGGANFARMMDKRTPTQNTQVELLFKSVVTYEYARTWSGGTGLWTIPQPSADVWHHIAVTYDASSPANDPLIYLDGQPQTVTEGSTPSGTLVNNSAEYVFGNRASDNGACWDGQIAEPAIWNRIFSPARIALLAAGKSPLLWPDGLVEYVPMLETDDPVTSCVLANPTVTGTLATAHPVSSLGCAFVPGAGRLLSNDRNRLVRV